MTNVLRALKSDTIEELASRLRSEGYQVQTGADCPFEEFDLTATNGDKKLAFAVGSFAEFEGRATEVIRRRQVARKHGYAFRLEVVNPPRNVPIGTEGLASALLKSLKEHMPDSFARLPQPVIVERVRRVEVDALDFEPQGGVHVKGNALVEVQVAPNQGGLGDGADDWRENLPFQFDIALNTMPDNAHVKNIDIDVSEYFE